MWRFIEGWQGRLALAGQRIDGLSGATEMIEIEQQLGHV